MKTRTKFILAALVLGLFGALLVVSHLLRFDQVRGEITRQLSEKLHTPVKVASVRWHWLPLPHLSLYDARLHYEQADFVLPETRIYFNWLSLLSREVEVGKMVFKKPDITVRLKGDFAETPFPALPKLRLVIDNGTLHFTSAKPLFGITSQKLELSAISASAKLTPDAIAFRGKANSSFSKGLQLNGRYNFTSHEYLMETEWRELQLDQLFTSMVGGTLVPVESIANFRAKIKGTGLSAMSADLYGELPCFLYKAQKNELLLDCGLVDLHFEKEQDNLLLTIKELELEKPGLRVNGMVKRTVNEGAEPIWELDLAGEKLDITAIRTALLTLFGDIEILHDICDVVQGGMARRASYTFKGRAADFEYLKYQTITAEAADAVIYIPEADLKLDQVNGRVLIQDGLLTVSEASAVLGQSQGRNCSLTLGLLEETPNPPFTLAVDIEAQATDITQALYNLVDYEPLQKELFRFTDLEGTATGHLAIGNTLDDFKVTVNVTDADIKGHYKRLASPFHIQNGSLRIEPPRVSWASLLGTLGKQRIYSLNGSVDWDKEVMLRIDNLNATLDGASLLAELNNHPEVAEYLAPSLTSLAGNLQLTEGRLEGPVLDHDKWRYSAKVALQDVSWQSPLLDGAVRGQGGELLLTDQQVTLTGIKGYFQKSLLELSGELRHQLLADWQGWVECSASLEKPFGAWLRHRQWFPEAAFPRLPGKIKGLRLHWDQDTFAASGTFKAGGVSLKKPPQLTFQMKNTPRNPLAMKIEISEQERVGRLQLDLLDRIPETFRLVWDGEVQASALKRLLDDSSLLTGGIKGNCSISLPQAMEAGSIKGKLSGTGLSLPLGGENGHRLAIREFSLAGNGTSATLQRVLLGLSGQEELAASGGITLVQQGLVLDLDLASPHLTRKTVLELAKDLKELRNRAGETATSKDSPAAWTITGTARFNFDEFVSGLKEQPLAAQEAPLAWRPLKGIITLKPRGKMVAEVTNGMLCCLDTKGTWFSDPESGVSHFSITTACPEPPKFEEVLPCIGIKQDVVQGGFALAADLWGDLDFWHSGRLTVTSGKGRILRMKLLSKVFSVVNLTGLFTGGSYQGLGEKGFAYSELTLETHIKDNILVIDKAVVRGEGLNLFGRGTLNLGTRQADITILIAPFKTIDTLVSKVPFLGRAIGGEEAAIITIPVGVKGDIRDPSVTVLAPDAVGESLLNLVKNTLLLPFTILSPILPGP